MYNPFDKQNNPFTSKQPILNSFTPQKWQIWSSQKIGKMDPPAPDKTQNGPFYTVFLWRSAAQHAELQLETNFTKIGPVGPEITW